MNPIKKKVIAQQTSEEVNIPLHIVEDVVSFYYKSVQKKLSSAEYLSVNVPNLGTFSVVKQRMINKSERLKGYLKKTEEDTSMAAFSNRKTYKKDLENYEILLTKFEEQFTRRQETQEAKEQFKTNKHDKSNTDLEREGQDS